MSDFFKRLNEVIRESFLAGEKGRHGRVVHARPPTQRPDPKLAPGLLRGLRFPSGSEEFGKAILNLKMHANLMHEDLALDDGVRDLQAHVINLAATNTVAAEIAHECLNVAPISKLFIALVREGSAHGAIGVAFAASERVRVHYLMPNGLQEDAMELPIKLWNNVCGYALRADAAGWPSIVDLLVDPSGLPREVKFVFEGSAVQSVSW